MQLNLFFSVEEQLEISITGKAKVYIAGFYKGENINRIRILSAALDSDGRLKEAIPKPTSERIPQKVINLKEASYEKDKTTVRRFEAKPNVQELRSQRTSSSLYDDYESQAEAYREQLEIGKDDIEELIDDDISFPSGKGSIGRKGELL